MKQNLIHLVVAASLITLATPVLADSTSYCDGTQANPCLVQDTYSEKGHDVKHWRDAKMIANAYNGNVEGLKHLWVSATAAPSETDFQTIANKIAKETDGKVTKMIDLDLRQENHGYLNGEAITLTDEHDWMNLGKTYQQSLGDEQLWLSNLRTQPTLYDVLTPDEFKSNDFTNGVTVQVNDIADEQSIAEKAGFEYQRLTVTDHMGPTDEDVDRFVSLVKNLPADAWVNIHCRGGDGRTTTFFAMYDMLKNADKVSFNDILLRQASVKPYYDLFALSHKDPDMLPYYQARLKFLRQFYQYASEVLRGYEGNWSQWKNENTLKKR